MDKKIKRALQELGIAFSASCFTLILFFGGLWITSSLFLDSTMLEAGRFMYIEKFSEDPYVINISSHCNEMRNDYDKVSCVNNAFKENFIYVKRDDSKTRSPTKMFEEGGLCRDAANTYCTILTKMGFECVFLSKHHEHVLSVVWINDSIFYGCLLDQKEMSCF